jgi:hypothetical protein
VIRAGGVSAAGEPMFLAGLTATNLSRLLAGKPIVCDTGEVGLDPPFQVLIVGGPTLDAVRNDLTESGLDVPADATTVAGVLAFTVRWHRRDRHLFVLGIQRATAERLLAGAHLAVRTPFAHRPNLGTLVVLLGGRDTDAIGSRIAGWMPGDAEVIDLRGGRTD